MTQTTAPLLRLQGVTKRYAADQPAVLSAVDMQLAAGELVALQGPSGEGKSTLLHLVAGLTPADSGSMHLQGQALHTATQAQLCALRRRQIGLIFQFFNLVPALTVTENLQLGFALNNRPIDHRAIEQSLAQLGLLQRQAAFPQQLSGGEQQRVAIARTLLQQPVLLMADEPTGNLDRENAQQVMQLLVQQARQHGTALLVATHDSAVAALADRRLQLRQGRLHES